MRNGVEVGGTAIHDGAEQLATSWVGQGVGLMKDSLSAKSIVYEFMEGYVSASERLAASLKE
mgnify:CR=1 FL=1